MHVTSCSVNPTTSCPGSSVTVTVKVQPDYFDIGTYDVRIYGRSGGSWSQIARKTGTANPLGGEFTLTHTISIPSSASFWYEIGAMDSGEGYAFPLKTTEVTLPPESSFLGTISASPTSGYASLTVQFSHSGGYGFNIIRWKIYKGNDLISTRNGQSFSHTFGAPGYYYIYAIPIDRCGKEGPQKSLTVTVEERSTDCSNPYGRQGDYHCKGTTTKYQCNNGAWTPVEYNSTWCYLLHRPTAQIPMESRVDIPVRARPGCSVLMGHGARSSIILPNAEADSPTRHRDARTQPERQVTSSVRER